MADQVRTVVVVVFDGLRPDLVRPDTTPNILRVTARGTWYRQARSVFPCVTRVATSSIATGAPPTVHGVVANQFYFPAAISDRVLDTSNRKDLLAAEAVTGGRFVAAPTFADQLARAGRRMMVVHNGSPGSAHCINPRVSDNGHWTFSIHGADATGTPTAVTSTVERFGPLPGRTLPKVADQDYAARLMTEVVLPARPDVALVWFSEPDTSFHYLEIGSEGARAGLANADRVLGEILDWIEVQPDGERFAIIVASDHGQISTRAAIPLFEDARSAGFPIASRGLEGARFVGAAGSAGLVYGRGAAPDELERLAFWLMDQPHVSHVLTRGRNDVEGEVEGTLALSLLGQDHARSPDLMFVLASDLGPDQYGLPGVGLLMPGDVAPGGGYHGGLNPHELNTLLVVAAPGRAVPEITTAEPAGIIDIGPTVLDLLGIPPADTMVGRSLCRTTRQAGTTRHFEARRGSFTQSVALHMQEGRNFILHGGQGEL